MKKLMTSVFLCLTILFCSSCSLSYFFDDYPAYFAGIVSFQEFHNGLVVDIPTVGICTIPRAENIYYLNEDTEIEKGDLIKISFDQRKSKIAIAESYPAQFSGIASYIEVQAKNLILERSDAKILFSQPTDEITRNLSVGDPLYFIKTGGENGKAYQSLFCASTITSMNETSVQLQLSFSEEDLLEEFLFYYSRLMQTPLWERF